jgi:hypothetical protein
MKRCAVGSGLCLVIVLVSPSAIAQDKIASTDESSVVRATVTDYIEAYYTGDVQRMAQTLDAHYLKHVIHRDIPVREKTAAEMLKNVGSQGGPPRNLPPSERTEKVTVLDISGSIASAKLVTPRWTDYLTLSKSEGQWKILSVVQRIQD